MSSISIVPVKNDMHYSHVALATSERGESIACYGHSMLEALMRLMSMYARA